MWQRDSSTMQKIWITKAGLLAVILKIDMGYGTIPFLNGYVLSERDMDWQYRISVHGGCTYANFADGSYPAPVFDSSKIWFGWDRNHFCDRSVKDRLDILAVMKECEEVAAELGK